jgi:hypothetical protein
MVILGHEGGKTGSEQEGVANVLSSRVEWEIELLVDRNMARNGLRRWQLPREMGLQMLNECCSVQMNS